MNPNQNVGGPGALQNIQAQIDKIQRDLETLSMSFYKNNFVASQDFNKTSRFNTRLKVPHYAATPATAEIGEIIEVGGKLYVASAVNTWTKVGLQT